jgi:Flp pilus assembly CpaE family ATPase
MENFKEIIYKAAMDSHISDLHMTVGLPPIYRLDGDLVNQSDYILTDADTEFAVRQLANDAQMETLKKTGEVLAENANKLRVFMDLGDAWDFEDDYRDQQELYMQLQSTCVRNFGDLTEIRQHYTFQNSSFLTHTWNTWVAQIIQTAEKIIETILLQ